jgi:hypothetical protein
MVFGGGLMVAVSRRRGRRRSNELAIDDPLPFPQFDVLADPLLEAMASSARANGGRHGSKKGLPVGEASVATWVKRLDAEINAMSDLHAAPSPPPHGRYPDPDADQTLTA